MELPRSTYYDQLEKGMRTTCGGPQPTSVSIGLSCCRLVDPVEVTSLAEAIGGPTTLPEPPSRMGVITTPARTRSEERAKVSRLELRRDAPPL